MKSLSRAVSRSRKIKSAKEAFAFQEPKDAKEVAHAYWVVATIENFTLDIKEEKASATIFSKWFFPYNNVLDDSFPDAVEDGTVVLEDASSGPLAGDDAVKAAADLRAGKAVRSTKIKSFNVLPVNPEVLFLHMTEHESKPELS